MIYLSRIVVTSDKNTSHTGVEGLNVINSPQVCITVSNSPNPSSVYIRLKHGKRFLLLKQYTYMANRDNNDVWSVRSCLYAPPRPAQPAHAHAHAALHMYVMFRAIRGFPALPPVKQNPSKLLGKQILIEWIHHIIPVTERNRIFFRVLFPLILLYSLMEWNKARSPWRSPRKSEHPKTV